MSVLRYVAAALRPSYTLPIVLAVTALALPAEASAAPDFNGDGRDDLVASAYREGLTGPGADEGTVHMIFGDRRKLAAGGGLEINQTMAWLGSNGPEQGEQFGRTSQTSGDFNGDGRDDMVIANLFESAEVGGESVPDAGAIHVVHGNRHGLRRMSARTLTQDSLQGGEQPEFGDGFGGALAAGDFNGDGYEDLAVSAHNEHLQHGGGELRFIGVVHLIEGGKRGLRPARSKLISPISAGIRGPGGASGGFGGSLASGDFDGDGRDDLAIGTNDDVGASLRAGGLHVLMGSKRKLLQPRRGRYLTEAKPAMSGPGAAESAAEFSGRITSGDFNGNGRDDLAVGTPGAGGRTGALHVFKGSRRGVTLRGDRYLTPNTPGMRAGEDRSGYWGSMLASGDLNADSRDDLAVGTGFGLDPDQCVGGVQVLFGSKRGVRKRHNQALTQQAPELRGDGEVRECDLFGEALLIADFNGRGPDELAIGEPQHFKNDPFEKGPGGIHVLYPDRSRDLTGRGYRYLTQDTPGVVSDGAEQGDAFGAVLIAP